MRPLPFAAAALLAALPPVAAWAQSVTVFGGGRDAAACFQAARKGDKGDAALASCSRAIGSGALTGHDLAGTYINRGVLRLVRGEYASAQVDFDQAVSADPGLPQSYANRGAAQIGQSRYALAITDIDHGLALGVPEPEKAYYNRALAREGLGDLNGAYADYGTAARLKPAWPDPRLELARFTVTRRTSR